MIEQKKHTQYVCEHKQKQTIMREKKDKKREAGEQAGREGQNMAVMVGKRDAERLL